MHVLLLHVYIMRLLKTSIFLLFANFFHSNLIQSNLSLFHSLFLFCSLFLCVALPFISFYEFQFRLACSVCLEFQRLLLLRAVFPPLSTFKNIQKHLIQIHFVSSFRRPEASFVVTFRNSVHDTKYKKCTQTIRVREQTNVCRFFLYIPFSVCFSYSTSSIFLRFSLQKRIKHKRTMKLQNLARWLASSPCMSQYRYVCINWLYSFAVYEQMCVCV